MRTHPFSRGEMRMEVRERGRELGQLGQAAGAAKSKPGKRTAPYRRRGAARRAERERRAAHRFPRRDNNKHAARVGQHQHRGRPGTPLRSPSCQPARGVGRWEAANSLPGETRCGESPASRLCFLAGVLGSCSSSTSHTCGRPSTSQAATLASRGGTATWGRGTVPLSHSSFPSLPSPSARAPLPVTGKPWVAREVAGCVRPRSRPPRLQSSEVWGLENL